MTLVPSFGHGRPVSSGRADDLPDTRCQRGNRRHFVDGRPAASAARRGERDRITARAALGAVEKAAHDRGKLEGFQQDAEHEARRILRELGRSIDLDEAETLRPRADEPAFIRVLGQRFAERRAQAEEARKTIARHESQIKRQARERADLEQPRDVEPLRRAIRQAQEGGDLDGRLVEARGKLAQAERKGATASPNFPAGSAQPKSSSNSRPVVRHDRPVRRPVRRLRPGSAVP